MGEIYAELKRCIDSGELVALATVVAGDQGAGRKMLIYPEETTRGHLGDAELEQTIRKDAMELIHAGSSETRTYETKAGPVDVFIEVYQPPSTLVVYGAVHVAVPLVKMAKVLGFRIILADPRRKLATKERFPDADEIVIGWPEEASQQIEIDASTYVAILTHDPKIDEPALESVLDSDARYIGAIGSRRTHEQRFERMAEQGVPREKLRRVHAPIGLDLGAKTPAEIATSILAEIVAAKYDKAEHLSLKIVR